MSSFLEKGVCNAQLPCEKGARNAQHPGETSAKLSQCCSIARHVSRNAETAETCPVQSSASRVLTSPSLTMDSRWSFTLPSDSTVRRSRVFDMLQRRFQRLQQRDIRFICTRRRFQRAGASNLMICVRAWQVAGVRHPTTLSPPVTTTLSPPLTRDISIC